VKRDFLTLLDITAAELTRILDLSAEDKAAGTISRPLAGKILGLIFEKPSTRTRVSFEAGIRKLGGDTVFLSSRDLQMGRGETIGDTGRVLSSYLDGLVVRTFGHGILTELAAATTIPVVNALTDLHHPCEALADLLTMREAFGTLAGLPVAYVGDGNNVANSLIEAAALAGLDMRIASPDGYTVDPGVVAAARAAAPGLRLTLTDDPRAAVAGTKVIYTDVWTSMGQEGEEEGRRAIFAPYRVDRALLDSAAPGAKAMHCLPAHRGEEISADVIDSADSLVWEQAANRLWAQMGLLRILYQGETT
jgi:ornithine carbamoyltransferase